MNRAIEILEVMDECIAALEAARLLRRAKEKAEARFSATTLPLDHNDIGRNQMAQGEVLSPLLSPIDGENIQLNNYWGSLGFIDGIGMDFDVPFPLDSFGDEGPAF